MSGQSLFTQLRCFSLAWQTHAICVLLINYIAIWSIFVVVVVVVIVIRHYPTLKNVTKKNEEEAKRQESGQVLRTRNFRLAHLFPNPPNTHTIIITIILFLLLFLHTSLFFSLFLFLFFSFSLFFSLFPLLSLFLFFFYWQISKATRTAMAKTGQISERETRQKC